jgi:hypothetical protein
LTEVRRHEASAERNESNEIIGALVIEQIETDLPREILAPRVDLVYEHAARALSNTVTHNSLFLLPVWRTLGKSTAVVKARNLPKTLTALLAIALLIGVMFFIPVDFKLAADGTLEPVVKKDVFAAVAGTVDKVLVEDQKLVQKGEVLVITRNAELVVELQKLQGEQMAAQQRLNAVREAMNTPRLTEDERVKLAGQKLELVEQLKSLEKQIEAREEQKEQLVLKAPITGRVMLSWDVERSLDGRKLEAGQMIMSIADPTGDWQLELLMPERRIGHVNKARQSEPELPVDYVLATDARRRLHGKVQYVDQVTRVHGDVGHSVLVRVEIDEKDVADNLRPGAKVHARVTSGRSSLGYRLFHEVIAWVQTKLLF